MSLFQAAASALQGADTSVPVPAQDDAARLALLARITLGTALSEAELHGPEIGLATLARSAGLARQLDDPKLAALVHGQRGLLLLRCGRAAEALDALDAAADLLDHVEPIDQCRILLNRSALHLADGRLTAARADVVRCLDLAQTRFAVIEAKARHNLGFLQYLTGDLPMALQTMAEAERTYFFGGVILLDRARVLLEAGLSREADEVLNEAATIFRRDRLTQDLGEVELERARCALVSGDLAVARRQAAQARDRFRRRGNDRFRRTAELVLLHADLAARRPGLRLTEPALRISREFEADGMPLLARSAALIAAEGYLNAGYSALAAEVFGRTRRPSHNDSITQRLHHTYVSARLDAAEGRSAVAVRRVRAGLAELSAYQASFGSIDLQTAAAVHGRNLAELGVSLAISQGRPAGVLAAAERARAVSNRLRSVRAPDDPEAAELFAELRLTVDALNAVAQDPAALADLRRKRRVLERQISERRWTLAGTGDVRPVARLDDVRSHLQEHDSDMVVYVGSQDELHAVAVGASGLRLYPLGLTSPIVEQIRRARADLDVLAQPRLPGGLRAAVQTSLRNSLTMLDERLIRPLALDGRRLVIVSTGVLGQLPWGALPSLRGVPLVVAPSATAWLSAARSPDVSVPGELVALAGPDVERAEHEVLAIATDRGATALIGAAASTEAFTNAMSTARIVHVAAHGVHQTESPLFSSVRLADGVVFAHELDQTAHTPEHVILSACELGLATVRPGDEALGLTSVLLQMGSRCVIAGVARVADEAAADAMIEYHRLLAKGTDSAAALAAAIERTTEPVPLVCFGASWSR